MSQNKMIFTHASGGGSCAGKTTGQAHLVDYAEQLGFNVLLCPEAATLLFGSGIHRDQFLQENVLDFQISNEQFYKTAAQRLVETTGKPVIISHDRGLLDGLAYLKDDVLFEKLLNKRGLSRSKILEGYYDSVTHLITAAKGALEHYNFENNIHRTETPEESNALDTDLQHAWLDAHGYEIIGNTLPDGTPKSFAQKMREYVTAVFNPLGLPSPVEHERRWTVSKKDFSPDIFLRQNVPVRKANILQTYVLPSSSWTEERVRLKLTEDGYIFLFHTKKRKTEASSKRVEKEGLVNQRLYEQLLLHRDLTRMPVKKLRRSFIWEEQVFTLDEYDDPSRNYLKLELEGSRIDHAVLPEFLPIMEEVTDKQEYGEHYAAQILK